MRGDVFCIAGGRRFFLVGRDSGQIMVDEKLEFTHKRSLVSLIDCFMEQLSQVFRRGREVLDRNAGLDTPDVGLAQDELVEGDVARG